MFVDLDPALFQRVLETEIADATDLVAFAGATALAAGALALSNIHVGKGRT